MGVRRLPLVAGGVAAMIAGGGLVIASGARLSNGVEALAPAPAGCETVLEFDDAGTYTFFLETSGSIGALEGDCAASARDYSFEGDSPPRVSLTLVDEGGNEVDLDRVDSPSYDAAGRQGVAIRTAAVPAGGSYTLTVDTNETDVVVRVGRNPSSGVSMMRLGGIGLAVIGAAGALAAWFVGRSSASPPPAVATGPDPGWQPGHGPIPVAPPTIGSSPQPPSWAPPPPPPPPRR